MVKKIVVSLTCVTTLAVGAFSTYVNIPEETKTEAAFSAQPQKVNTATEKVPIQPSTKKSALQIAKSTKLKANKERTVWAIVNTENGPEVKKWKTNNEKNAVTQIKKIQKNSNVAAISIDSKVTAAATSYGGLRSSQWALDTLNVDTSWKANQGENVVVAVVDSGVDASHPNLANVVNVGKDYVSPTSDGKTDPNGHGTHVSGIIASQGLNGGTVGQAPKSKILPVRVLNASGSGWDSDVNAGIIWAADQGADIINASVGSTVWSAGGQAAVTYATSKGSLVVAAAGNGKMSGNSIIYPSGYSSAMAVGATDVSNKIAAFSTTGPQVDVSAPGVSILSTWPGGYYQYASGTSMATPYAASAAALLLSEQRKNTPGAKATDVANDLRTTAIDIGTQGRDDSSGYGLIQPANVVCPTGCLTPTTPSPTPTETSSTPSATPSGSPSDIDNTPSPTPTETTTGSPSPSPSSSATPSPSLTPTPSQTPTPSATPTIIKPTPALLGSISMTIPSKVIVGSTASATVTARYGKYVAANEPVTFVLTTKNIAKTYTVYTNSAGMAVLTWKHLANTTILAKLPATAKHSAAGAIGTVWATPKVKVTFSKKKVTTKLSKPANKFVLWKLTKNQWYPVAVRKVTNVKSKSVKIKKGNHYKIVVDATRDSIAVSTTIFTP